MAPKVQAWAASDALLFLWATFPKLLMAVEVMEAWGFRYSTVGFVWIKSNKGAPTPMPSLKSEFPMPPARPFFGTGYYAKSNTEVCLLGVKGKALKPATDHASQLIISPLRAHSQKPDEVQFRIEAMYPNTKKLEMFARRERPGWDHHGNEL